jgi:hypothetical protein
MQTRRTTAARPWSSVIDHLRSFVSFYLVSRSVEIESCFPVSESIERLLALNRDFHAEPRLPSDPSLWERLDRFFGWRDDRPEVHVHIAKRSRLVKNPFRKEVPNSTGQAEPRRRITVGCAHQSARSNILHLFKGGFVDLDGSCVLRGEIGLDRGISCVLGIFCALLWVVFPLRALVQGRFSGSVVAVMLVLWGLLELIYLFGQNDAEIILRNLRKALTPGSAAAEPLQS